MTRDWLYYRVSAPAPAPVAPVIAGLVPHLVTALHSADPEGQWFFLRLVDWQGPHLRVRFRSTPVVIDAIEHVIMAESRKRELTTVLDYYEPEVAKYRGMDGVGAAEKVFDSSSEFVLTLLDGAGSVGVRTLLPLVTWHLERVVGLLAAEQRVSFLFHYWCYWTNGMSTALRAELGERAVRGADTLRATAEAITLPDRARAPWQRYVATLRDAATDPRHGSVSNHHVFHHAHLTHNRLGAWPATEALAARILHLQLVGRPPCGRSVSRGERTSDDHEW